MNCSNWLWVNTRRRIDDDDDDDDDVDDDNGWNTRIKRELLLLSNQTRSVKCQTVENEKQEELREIKKTRTGTRTNTNRHGEREKKAEIMSINNNSSSSSSRCLSLGFHSNAIACVGKQPIMVAIASTEHSYWLALAFAVCMHATNASASQ